MGKRAVAVGIILVILLSSLPLAFGYFETNIIDTSWTGSVTQFLNNAQPYPQWKEEYNLNAYTITLFENGTSTFVNATNGDSLSSYLLNVMSRANGKMSSVSDAFVSNVTQNDKVVYLRSRLGTNFTQAGTFVWDTYFVLEDNLYQGSLKGTIFIEHDSDNVRTWQHWAILLGQSPTLSPSPLTFTPTVSSPTQTDTTITLSWTKTNTTTFGILGSYQVTYATSVNGSYNTAATITDWNQTSYIVTGLTPNTTYYFVIRYIGNNVIGSNLALSNTLEAKTSSSQSSSIPSLIIVGLVIAVVVVAVLVYLKKRRDSCEQKNSS